jgi:hypothetical protein
MNPARLFNCCAGHAAPDWSQFDRLEVGGCVRDPEIDGFTIGGAPASAAEFFTVYGRFKEPDGTWDAITDADNALEALAVAAELSTLSGLQCTVCPSLMERAK